MHWIEIKGQGIHTFLIPIPIYSNAQHCTFVFDGVEADRLTVSPQQAAAFGTRVQGEQRLLFRGSLHNLTEQEQDHPLHNRPDLEKKTQLFRMSSSSNDSQI